MHKERVLFSAGVNKDGKIYIGNPVLVSGRHQVSALGYDFVFEFANGFVVPIRLFTVRACYSDFQTVSFHLLGHNETFTFRDDFFLSLRVTGYSGCYVSGFVLMERTVADTAQTPGVRVGDFELSRSGTVYKGERLPIVYNKVRYTKELMLRG